MKCMRCGKNAKVVYDMEFYCKRCFHDYKGFAVDFKRFVNWLKERSRGGAVRADNDLVIMTVSLLSLKRIYEDAKNVNSYIRSKSALSVKRYLDRMLEKAEKARYIDEVS